jgi:hypothetical protein
VDRKKAISMRKQKTKTGQPLRSPKVALVDQMRQALAATEIEGDAQMPALLIRHLQGQYRAAPAGSPRRRRLLALRLALLGGQDMRLKADPHKAVAPVEPAPEPAPPPPPPEPPKGVVNSISLENAAKMLFAAMGGDDEPADQPAPFKVDFSMFGDSDSDSDSDSDAATADLPSGQTDTASDTAYDPFDDFAEPAPAKAAPLIVDFGDWDDSDAPAQTEPPAA